GRMCGGRECRREPGTASKRDRDGKADDPFAQARGFVARKNRQNHRHGGRSGPLDSSPLSPQRKTAPCARPARRKDDVFRQVSWLAGRDPSPPSQALSHKAQWQPEEGLAADSCGGSSGFDSPWERRIAPDSLLGRSTRPAHLNAVMEGGGAVFVNTPKFICL